MSLESICVHESGHAVISLALGHVPIEIFANSSGGHVTLEDGIPDVDAAIVGLAGALGVEAILGDTDTMSLSDAELVCGSFAHGRRHQTFAAVSARAAELIHKHQFGIVAVANQLLLTPIINKADLSRLVHRAEALQSFTHLFPDSQPAGPITLSAMRGRGGHQARSSSRGPSMAADYIIGRLLAGKGSIPAGINRGEIIARLRQS